jgi:hypothetical protein
LKSRTRRVSIWLILTVAAAISVTGLGAALAVRLLAGPSAAPWLTDLFRRRDRSLDEVVRRADEELSKGYTGRAEDALDEGYRQVRGEAGYLRLLKRELRLARIDGSYRRFARNARKAAEELPGSRSLAEAAAYAALRSEHPEEAAAVLEHSSRYENLDALRAEAYLGGWISGYRRTHLEDRLRLLAELPGVSDPNAMHTLAAALEEPRLDLDASLLWMKQGLADQAFGVLWPHRARPGIAEALLYIAFDAGRYTEAWQLQSENLQLNNRPDQSILRGDLAWLLGMPEAAAEQYQRTIEAYPDYSWTAYLNLAGILDAAGDPTGARDFRRRAHARFPDQAEVILAYVRDLAGTGETERASELLGSLLERDPGQVSAQLLALDLGGVRSSPALFQGRMWRLLNQHPDQPELVRSFALYLIGMRDLSAASAVLSQYERAHDGAYPPWFLELQGIVALAGGRPEEAARFLRESIVDRGEWRRRYNLALALMAGEHHAEALQELIESETELLSGETAVETLQNRVFRSRIRSRIAEAKAHLGDLESSRREALYALDLDNANHHARQVLRILDGIR